MRKGIIILETDDENVKRKFLESVKGKDVEARVVPKGTFKGITLKEVKRVRT